MGEAIASQTQNLMDFLKGYFKQKFKPLSKRRAVQ